MSITAERTVHVNLNSRFENVELRTLIVTDLL